MRGKYLFLYGLIVANLFLLGWIILSQTELRENYSESLSGINYIIFQKIPKLERGDIVAIKGHREDHVGKLPKFPYSKRILGLPGDPITRDQGIKINDRRLNLLKQDRYGKPLNPLTLKRVPQGYLFVAGDNHNSFDSRYEEFGLVPIEKITGKALFAW